MVKRGAGAISKLILLIYLSVAAGCATVWLPYRLEQVEHLIAQQQYARAQGLLQNIDTQDPDYEALVRQRRALGPLTQQLEQSTIEQAQQLERQQRWESALSVIDDGLVRLPESEALQQARNDLLLARKSRIAALKNKYYLLQGRQLPAQAELLEQIVAADPENLRNRWQVYQLERQIEQVSTGLEQCGEEATAAGDHTLAQDCQQAAKKLAGEPVAAKETEPAAPTKLDETVIQVDKQAVKQLKREYRDFVSAGWWLAAKGKLEELQEQAPKDHQVKKWSQWLQESIDKQVALGIKQGQALYSQGHLDQALEEWESAAALAPDNQELQGHIARVERFLANLGRLNGKEP